MKISDALLLKLNKIEARYGEIGDSLSKPEILSNQEQFRALSKEHSDLMPIVEKYAEYKRHKSDLEDCNSIIATETDAEMKNLARQEADELREALERDVEEIKLAMLPKDPNENNNVIMEIRAGAGGDEASLFGTELMKMYRHFADANRWKIEEVNMNYTELGGAKELVFMITGKGVYGKLKYESGVHRVQRVPETESQGRVHTSTVTVAVLPEAQDVEINLNENDIKVDTYRSGGAGGQHVNKTESAIRMTHLPTGIVVECQDERSQIKNREKALKVLKSRIYDYYQSQAQKEYAENRRAQVGTGDRSERIRTYNFPQGRVTDHRIGLSVYNLTEFIMGDIEGMIEALTIADREAKLAGAED